MGPAPARGAIGDEGAPGTGAIANLALKDDVEGMVDPAPWVHENLDH